MALDELFAELLQAEDHLYLSRLERKYLVPEHTAQALRHAFSTRLALEEFVSGRAQTLVHSIYFDSPDWALYQESLKVEGSLKFRLRGYATPGLEQRVDPGLFFECKLGVRDALASKKRKKLRFSVPHSLATMLFERHGARRAATGMLRLAPQPSFWRKALAFLSEKRLVPQLTICYERTAYLSADGRLRVTLDEGFTASRIQPNNASRVNEPRGTLPGLVIVEVKFLGEFPQWITQALNERGLAPEGRSFSKFKAAVPLLVPEMRSTLSEVVNEAAQA